MPFFTYQKSQQFNHRLAIKKLAFISVKIRGL